MTNDHPITDPTAPPTLLIVDDEPSARQLLNAYLSRRGFQIMEAGTGEQALEVMRGDRLPDLVLLDVMMPYVDGEAMMAYVNSFPGWASAAWGLGVWGGLLGAILLLMRNRLAVPTFAASAVGAIVGIGYQLMRPAAIPDMHQGFGAAMPYVIILVAALLFLYARSLREKGVLR